MVGVEGDRAAVVGEGIDFDDEALLAPEEVDFVTAEFDVDLGRWDEVAVRSDEREEEGLEVAAGAVALDAVEVVALQLGLAQGAAGEVRWEKVGAISATRASSMSSLLPMR